MIEEENELNFLIAKYLKIKFPQIFPEFINNCEKNELFPKNIFGFNNNFSQLNDITFENLPNNYLFLILKENNLLKSFISKKKIKKDIKNNEDFLINNLSFQKRIIGHFDSISTMIIDHTNQLLITGSIDSLIKIWKIPEILLISSFSAHNDSIICLSIHPKNIYLLSTSKDNTICLFNLLNGIFLQRISVEENINCISFSPCGLYVAESSLKLCYISIRKINFEKNQLSKKPISKISIPTNQNIQFFKYSPNGSYLLIISHIQEIFIVSLIENSFFILKNFGNNNFKILLSKKEFGTLIIYNHKENNFKKIDTEKLIFDTRKEISINLNEKLKQISFNCDETRIITLLNQSFQVWDSLTNNLIFIQTDNNFLHNCSFLIKHPSNPSLIFIYCKSGKGSIWDISYKKLILFFEFQDYYNISNGIWSFNGNYIFFYDKSGGIIVIGLKNSNSYLFEQFFPREINSNSSDASKIVDINGNVHLFQPKSFKLNDFKLEIINHFEINYKKNLFSKFYKLSNLNNFLICEKNLISNTNSLIFSENEDDYDTSSNFISSSEEIEINIPKSMPEWVFMNEYHFHTYIPQINEEIVYFWKGHYQLRKLCPIDCLIPSYEVLSKLPLIIFGKIILISFEITHFILTIKFHNYNDFIVKISFCLPDSPPFIVPLWKYEQSMIFANNLHVDSIVEIPYSEKDGIKNFGAIIEKIRYNYKENPFECFKVGFIDGGEMSRVSPWEIIHKENPENSKLKLIQQNLFKIVESLLNLSNYNDFYLIRNKDQLNNLFLKKKLPIDLTLISLRLKNNWYQTVEEIQSNINLLKINAELLGLNLNIANELINYLNEKLTTSIRLLNKIK